VRIQGGKLGNICGGKLISASGTAIYQKNESHRTIDANNEYEPKLADEKDIDLRLPVARLAAIIGPTFAGL
jgi:hypothetical protein